MAVLTIKTSNMQNNTVSNLPPPECVIKKHLKRLICGNTHRFEGLSPKISSVLNEFTG